MNTRDQPLGPKQPSTFRCFMCWLTGTDPELLGECPKRDVDNVLMVFLLQGAVLVWQTAVFAVSAHIMLAPAGVVRWDLLVASLLLAAIICLIDSYMIIRSSWFLHGLDELKRGGLLLPGSVAARVTNIFFVSLRIILASVSAVLVAAVVTIVIFAKDINARLASDYQAQNSQLIASVAQQYDAGIDDLERSRAQLEAQITRDGDFARQPGYTVGMPQTEAERLQAAAARVAELEKSRAAEEAALRQAQAFASDELAGIRHDPRNSGVPGRGARRLAAEERRRLAEDKLRSASRDLAIERKRLDELRQAAAVRARQDNELVVPRLASMEATRQRRLKELAELDSQLAERRAARPKSIQDAVERDPAFRSREDGLLARAHALIALAEDPWVKALIIGLDVLFFMVELAAVLVKTITFVPSSYATRLAKEEYLRAHAAARDIAEATNLIGRPKPDVDAFVPPRGPADGGPPSQGSKSEKAGPGSLEATLHDAARRTGTTDRNEPDLNVGSSDPTIRRPRGRPRSQPPTLPSLSEPLSNSFRAPPNDGNLFGSEA